MLVRVNGRRLEYRPIADASAGRESTPGTALEDELRQHQKERAEHVMLGDLDQRTGWVSEYGSVKVRDLMYVERYSHVMHLVSAIEGCLRPQSAPWDAFAARFPAGTLSGAPKVRAMQIIEVGNLSAAGIMAAPCCMPISAGNPEFLHRDWH